MTEQSHTPSMDGFELATRHMVMERHMNPFGHLFGGTMLAWLDEGSALYLMEKIGYRDFVTVSMEHVAFKAPGRRGDAIQILCRVVRTGRSSVVVQSKAVAHDARTGSTHEIITCEITYVCLKDDKAFPYFQSPEYQAWQARNGRNGAAAPEPDSLSGGTDAAPKADVDLPMENATPTEEERLGKAAGGPAVISQPNPDLDITG